MYTDTKYQIPKYGSKTDENSNVAGDEKKLILSQGNFKKIAYLIKKANAPLPPENSHVLRIVVVACVLVGMYAAYQVQEVSFLLFISIAVVTIIGNIFSAVTRKKPYSWIKILLAIAATAVFSTTTLAVISAASQGNIPSILSPLAALFMWIIAIHSFDVPARRDLTFSLSGSAGLIAVSSAQALDNSFAVNVVVWILLSLVALNLMWRSLSQKQETVEQAVKNTTIAIAVAALVTFSVILILPPPKPLHTTTFPASIQNKIPVTNPGGLTQGGSNPAAPAKPGHPGGRVEVGGYLGFAGPLNTGLRGKLSNQIVMRVRATEPGYWLGETFNTWNGQSWTQTPSATSILTGDPVFYIPSKQLGEPVSLLYDAPQNTETFYVATALPNLLFSTESPSEIYFPDSHLYIGPGRSIRSRFAIEAGTIYTVISRDIRLTDTQLENIMPPGSSFTTGIPANELKNDLQLPKPYLRVKKLADTIVKKYHAKTTYEIVSALESWMGSHMHYSLNIPPLPKNADSVDQFLFVTKTGFCEQISSALVVMLRTLGIPSREAVGYVAGSYDPITDLYQVKASDAHAWVQVWYGPNGGWQDTDPTTSVPFTTPSPGQIILSATANFFKSNLSNLLAILAGLFISISAGYLINKRLKFMKLSFAEKAVFRLNKISSSLDIKRDTFEPLNIFMERFKYSIRDILNKDPTLELKIEELTQQLNSYGYDPQIFNDNSKTKQIQEKIQEDLDTISKSVRSG